MTLIAKMPIKNAVKKESAVGRNSTITACPRAQMSYTSMTSDSKMTGMDIKKENFAISSLSLPHKSPAEIVLPEREMPGKTAKPCATPMKSTVFKSRFPFFFGASIPEKSKIAPVITKQTGSAPPIKDAFTSGISTSTIRQVGIVAATRKRVCLESGCLRTRQKSTAVWQRVKEWTKTDFLRHGKSLKTAPNAPKMTRAKIPSALE